MERARLRLTGTSYAVLAIVNHLTVATPYDLKQAIERSTQNFWQVPHTTAYQELARLAASGFLSEHQEAGGRRRKRYTLTAHGRDALCAWAEQPQTDPPQLRDEALLKVFAGADPKPILESRQVWHRRKLMELEDYLETIRQKRGAQPELAGPERTLLAGVVYHRKMLEVIQELAERRTTGHGRERSRAGRA